MNSIRRHVWVILLFFLSCQKEKVSVPNLSENSLSLRSSAELFELGDFKTSYLKQVYLKEIKEIDFNSDGRLDSKDLDLLESYPQVSSRERKLFYNQTLGYFLDSLENPNLLSVKFFDVNRDALFTVDDVIEVRRVISKRMNETYMVNEIAQLDLRVVSRKIEGFVRTLKHENDFGFDLNDDGEQTDKDIAVWKEYLFGRTSVPVQVVGKQLIVFFKQHLEEKDSQDDVVRALDFNNSGVVDIKDVKPLRNFIRAQRLKVKKRTQIDRIAEILNGPKFLKNVTKTESRDSLIPGGLNKASIDRFAAFTEPDYSQVYLLLARIGLSLVDKNPVESWQAQIFDSNFDGEVDIQEIDEILLFIAKPSS